MQNTYKDDNEFIDKSVIYNLLTKIEKHHGVYCCRFANVFRHASEDGPYGTYKSYILRQKFLKKSFTKNNESIYVITLRGMWFNHVYQSLYAK
jgi:hypothetical protein